MKNWKQSVFFGLVAIIALGFGFIGCDNGEVEVIDYPKDQSQIITLTFGTESPTATVKGHLTNTQWNGVANKIKTAFDDGYSYYITSTGDDLVPSIYRGIFARGITAIVEKNPSGYNKWKTTNDGKTMYLAYGELDNDLLSTILSAIDNLWENKAANG